MLIYYMVCIYIYMYIYIYCCYCCCEIHIYIYMYLCYIYWTKIACNISIWSIWSLYVPSMYICIYPLNIIHIILPDPTPKNCWVHRRCRFKMGPPAWLTLVIPYTEAILENRGIRDVQVALDSPWPKIHSELQNSRDEKKRFGHVAFHKQKQRSSCCFWNSKPRPLWKDMVRQPFSIINGSTRVRFKPTYRNPRKEQRFPQFSNVKSELPLFEWWVLGPKVPGDSWRDWHPAPTDLHLDHPGPHGRGMRDMMIHWYEYSMCKWKETNQIKFKKKLYKAVQPIADCLHRMPRHQGVRSIGLLLS